MAKHKVKKSAAIKISACYMVKNEEKDLARSLKSLVKYVDEIIVVDTGSTDSTVDVAKSFGAKIFHEAWQDDFSTPRNVAIKNATGDWIVFLDADEYFVNDSAKNLQAVIKLAQKSGTQGISINLVNIDTDNNDAIINSVYVLRMFKNAPNLHYVGKIHEDVFLGDEPLTRATAPAKLLTLYHTGYSKTIIRSKLERNLKLLLEELATSDKPERTYAYLVDCYYGLKDWANAEKFARLELDARKNPSNRPIRILIEILEKDPARADECFEITKLAVALYPKVPEFSAQLADCFAKRGDYREAVKEMRRAIDKAKNYGEQFEATNFDADKIKIAQELIEKWSLTISACYMVKNGEKDLARSLESLSQYVDEIIVVDTGSTDSSVDVAKSFGAKIFHETWQDDFSTPRNIALNAAKSSWIVFLDADEYFINDTAKNLRQAIELAQEKNIKGVFVNLVNVDADNDNKNLGAAQVLRLYENAAGVHYVGKIHEQVFIGNELLTSLMTVPADLLTIWHTGYYASIHKAKMERNLKSLLEELAVTTTPKRIYGYLAETYHALNDDINAEKFARLDVDSGETLSDNSTRVLLEILSKKPAQIDDYLKYLRLAIERYPNVPEFSAKLAEALADGGDYQNAIDEMTRAIELGGLDDKTLAYCENLLAQWRKKLSPEDKRRIVDKLTKDLIYAVEILHDKKKILSLAEKIFALEPATPEPLEKAASVYIDCKKKSKAEEVVTYLEKNFPPSSYRLLLRARVHYMKNNALEALKFAQQALALENEDLAHKLLIHNILGQAYRLIGDAEKSIEHYKISSSLDLSPIKNPAKLAQAKKIQREEYSNLIFNLHNLNVSREELFNKIKDFNKFFTHIPRYKHNIKKHARHKKIRVGYISPDIRFHVVAFFSQHFFMSYDKMRFEIFIYANNDEDNVTAQIKEKVDGFRNIKGIAPKEVAAQIVKDEIDILVDLAGHSANNSLEVLAYKPAPIQISGIGWFNSTGLDTVDYFLADKFTDPEGLNEKFFTEKILRLQHSHFCYVWHDFPFMTVPAPCTKAGYVTFASFNNFNKVTDEMLRLWGKILNAVPDSRLYLKGMAFYENCGIEFVKGRMTAAGIDLERVDFEPFNTVYVQCYERVDIALDTFPYPGGGTTCDALYMGVPVITLVGERHNSRFGYSLLMNMGLEELCAFSEEEYVQKAVALANDRERLREYHLTIRRKMELSPVMNDTIYMGELEQAYEKIFTAWLNKNPLPDFPQEPEVVTAELADKYFARAKEYVSLEKKGGGSNYPSRFDFKRTLYYAELAAQCESKLRAEIFLTIADRRYLTNENLGAYEAMHKAIERLYPPYDEAKNLSSDVVAEYFCKMAKYCQDNGRHVEAIKNYEQAFDICENPVRKIEYYDAILLTLHFLDISSEEITAPHFDYQNLFAQVEPFKTYHEPHARIRVGYLSGDFRKHAAFAVIFGFISCHDKTKFEIFCYSRNKEDDVYTELFKKAVEHFVNVKGLTDEQIAQKIHDDEIDIAFDLAGHTGSNFLPSLAYRPAPVQICGIGYMSTTGSNAIDYFITDEILDPPNEGRTKTAKNISAKNFCTCLDNSVTLNRRMYPLRKEPLVLKMVT